ncbi:MAG: radical SAM protein [Patescibacteria group bacterium]
MSRKSSWGICPDYLNMLQRIASQYLGSGALSMALQQGVQNLQETYSPAALRRRAEKRRNWGFAPEGYTISVTSACNLNCSYCYYRAGDSSKNKIVHIDFNKLGIVLREMKENFGLRFVTLTGGETTFYLREIAVRWPDITFYAYTNGKLLNAEYCRNLEELGNVMIALTIVGTEAIHENVRPDNYIEVMAAVENLQRTSLVWGFSLTESRINYHEIVENNFLDFLMRFRPFFLRMIPFMPVGRERDNLALTLDEYSRIAEVIKVKRKRNNVPIHDYINDPNIGFGCMAGGVRSFLITEQFKLSPCVFMDTLTPPLEFRDKNSNLMKILRDHPYFRRARNLTAYFPRCIILENNNWRKDIVL